ncbi:MAG: hypothetical protein QNI91_15880 [Arenicellales bacterium]|nr:hypothetical protein [Arenicellales bacterium]
MPIDAQLTFTEELARWMALLAVSGVVTHVNTIWQPMIEEFNARISE